MPAPPLTLAGHYQPGIALQAYWVSEKYDGIRAYWDGAKLYTRQGHAIAAPAWFTQSWPAQPLDGELWAGRGQFAQVQSTVAQHRASAAQWQQLRYMVFDAPAQPGPFGARLQWLQRTLPNLGQPWLQVVPQWRVATHQALQRQLREIEAAGGEGLMLRHDAAPYRGGRQGDLLKLKSLQDAEARVVAHIPGKGQWAGMLGALEVQMPSGQRFRIGTGLSQHERRHPPPIGSTITYRYQGTHASGLPRFARFWRVREEADAAAP